MDFFFDRADRNKWPPVQRAAKARSWLQFIKGSKTLFVERRTEALRVVGLGESADEPEVASEQVAPASSDARLGRLARQVAAQTPEHSGAKPYS